jgi:hypothetical protein
MKRSRFSGFPATLSADQSHNKQFVAVAAAGRSAIDRHPELRPRDV